MPFLARLLVAAALATISIILHGCTGDLVVSVSYLCIDNSGPDETCKLWRQTGSIKPEPKACFSEDALVITPNGPKAMVELQVGDELLGFDHATGQTTFTKVRAWLHRTVEVLSDMTLIETDDGMVVTSPMHSIATGSIRDSTYVFADDLQVGQALIAANGSSVAVRKLRKQQAKGFYSPLTHTSNFFVGSSPRSAVLAHNFAHLTTPRWYEPIVHSAMAMSEVLFDNIHHVGPHDSDQRYLHPVLRPMLNFAPFAQVSPFVDDAHGGLLEWSRNLSMTGAQMVGSQPVLSLSDRRLKAAKDKKEDLEKGLMLLQLVMSNTFIINDYVQR
jgi:hypothetical protein